MRGRGREYVGRREGKREGRGLAKGREYAVLKIP